MTSACPWPISYASCNDCEALDTLTAEERAKFEQMATDLLFLWTGEVFGICPVEYRPCRSDCSGLDALLEGSTFWGRGPFPSTGGGAGSGSFAGVGVPWIPVLFAGRWFNITCGCTGSCACDERGGAESLRLPGPVQSIISITIDGVLLDPSQYRVDHKRYLRRIDGEDWPLCQDLTKPATEEGTWEIVYQRGIEVPVGGELSAGLLACELAKAFCGDPTCGLPQRVQSVTRQGISVAIVDSFDDVVKGRTGIWAVDAWVASIVANEEKPRRGTVFSPDFRERTFRRQPWQVR